jgi:hypothetical protein
MLWARRRLSRLFWQQHFFVGQSIGTQEWHLKMVFAGPILKVSCGRQNHGVQTSFT